MIIKNFGILTFIIILTFSFMFFAMCIAYSQGHEYIPSYFPLYYPTGFYNTSGIYKPTYSYSAQYITATGTPLAQSFAISGYNMLFPQPEPQSVHYGGMIYGYNGLVDGIRDGIPFLRKDTLITNGIFNQVSGNYQQIVNPVALFNQEYAYLSGKSVDQQFKVSFQKCLQERKDLDMTRCMMLRRYPSPSVSEGYSSGHIGNILGYQFQTSAFPSSDYLSLYFLCFEKSQY